MLKNVAVAVDGSPASLEALQWVAQWLGGDGQIIAVDIKDPSLFYRKRTQAAQGGDLDVDEADFLREWEHNAQKVQEKALQIATQAGAHLEWQTVPVSWNHNTPAAAFYDYACQRQADALAVGRHHGSVLVEGLFGSFPRWLITHSDRAVIVIPPSDSR